MHRFSSADGEEVLSMPTTSPRQHKLTAAYEDSDASCLAAREITGHGYRFLFDGHHNTRGSADVSPWMRVAKLAAHSRSESREHATDAYFDNAGH
jgi:hypothetical protein